jgi:hypothetical protein
MEAANAASGIESSESRVITKPEDHRRRHFWTTPRLARLDAEIADLCRDLETYHGCHPDIHRAASALLEEATRAQKEGDVDSAWQHLYHAREELVRDYDNSQLKTLAMRLQAEIGDPGKMTQWRRQAIGTLLEVANFDENTALESNRSAVVEALRIRNQGESNAYWRLTISRHYQTILLVLGAPVLIASVTILAISSSKMGEADWKKGWVPCVLSVLLGVIGAITSAAQRSTNILPERIATQLGSAVASLSRVPIGAVAGLTVWLFTIATVERPEDINAANLLLAAFGAGFAERLIVQGSTYGSNVPDTSRQDGKSS